MKILPLNAVFQFLVSFDIFWDDSFNSYWTTKLNLSNFSIHQLSIKTQNVYLFTMIYGVVRHRKLESLLLNLRYKIHIFNPIITRHGFLKILLV